MITPDTISSGPSRERIPAWFLVLALVTVAVALGTGISIGRSVQGSHATVKPVPAATVFTPGARVTVPAEPPMSCARGAR